MDQQQPARQYAYFGELPVTTTFSLNGNLWRKRSTRTAEIVKPEHLAGTWFYFGNRELCVTARHTRLAASYHDQHADAAPVLP